MKHALLLHHWDSLEMWGTFNELYRNKSSNTKPEHINNFNTAVSEHQPLSQLCQKNCVSGRTDVVSTGSGDVSKKQLGVVDVHGPCHGREGAGVGTSGG